MGELGKIRWFSHDNHITASLMRFHAGIYVQKSKNKLDFKTVITDEKMDQLIMHFGSLEEAFTFVTSVVDKCWTMQDLLNACSENYQDKKPRIKKHKDEIIPPKKRDNLQ